MRTIYPVIFTESEGNILIEVPDLGILSETNEEGKSKGTMADAIATARDAIGIHCISKEDCGQTLPIPSDMMTLDASKGTFADEGKSIISLVDVDLVEYRRKIDNRSVRRNVTLPNWLNIEAEKAHINVSKVLQDALMTTLGVSK
ncbi:MAG: type II toxin-antitoxin system HicB family antitoxin [Eubacteriales bacterium]|nr:type II toxin-antitoxin system HicB family antitoxin [Eubacteriales bacterium]